jgi:hypothetical protein
MADSLHLALSAFRDTMLTAVARLEFAIRDTERSVGSSTPSDNLDTDITRELCDLTSSHTSIVGDHSTRIDILEKKFQSFQEQLAAVLKATEETKELLKIPAPSSTTKNVLISTPALSAAVAATIQPPAMDLDEEEEEEEEVQYQDVQMNGVGEGEVVEEEEEDDDDSLPNLRQVTIKGKQYFMDSENSVYVETDEGYEEIGKYNPALDCIEGAEEEEADVEQEEEEDEEAVEVEEFVYKNKIYQRDTENNVYDDGEHIGTWNGKKIIPLA